MNQALKEMRWEGVQEDIDATWADVARCKAETKELAKRQKESELATKELVERAQVIIAQRARDAMSSPANNTRNKQSAGAAENDQRSKKKNFTPRRTRKAYAYEKLRKTTGDRNLTPINEAPTDPGSVPNLRPTGLRTQDQEQRQLQHCMPSNPNLTGNLTAGQETMAGAYPNSGYNTGYDRRDQFYGAPTGQNLGLGPGRATGGFGGQHHSQAYPSPSHGFSPVRPTLMSAPEFAVQASASSLNLSTQGWSVQQGQVE